MRLDKFLKISRLIKRRTVANEFCDLGCVLINGKTAKASSEVKAGDELTLLFGNRTTIARIESVPAKAPSVQEASSLYTILSEERKTTAPALSDSLET